MKTIVFSLQSQKTLPANGLDCRVMNNFEQFVAALAYISCTSANYFEMLAFQVEVLQIIFDLKIDSTEILVSQVRVIGDRC